MPAPSSATTLAGAPVVASVPKETPIVMITLFIKQNIDLGILDIMYQLSGQLVEKNIQTYGAKKVQ